MFLGSVLERVLGFSSNLYSAVYFRLMMRPVRLVQVLIANSCKSFGMKCVSLSQTYPCILCYNTKGCYNTMVMFFLILSYKRVASIGLCLSYRVTLFFYLFSGKEQLILVSVRVIEFILLYHLSSRKEQLILVSVRVKEINILYLLYSRKNS